MIFGFINIENPTPFGISALFDKLTEDILEIISVANVKPVLKTNYYSLGDVIIPKLDERGKTEFILFNLLEIITGLALHTIFLLFTVLKDS